MKVQGEVALIEIEDDGQSLQGSSNAEVVLKTLHNLRTMYIEPLRLAEPCITWTKKMMAKCYKWQKRRKTVCGQQCIHIFEIEETDCV